MEILNRLMVFNVFDIDRLAGNCKSTKGLLSSIYPETDSQLYNFLNLFSCKVYVGLSLHAYYLELTISS